MIGKIWEQVRDDCAAVVADAIFFVTCLSVLVVTHPLIERLPVPDDQKDFLEAIHSTGLAASILVLSVACVLRLLHHSVAKVTRNEQ